MNPVKTISYLLSCASIAAILGIGYLSITDTAYIRSTPAVRGIETRADIEEVELPPINLSNYSGEWAVYFKEKNKETIFEENPNLIYHAASLNKLVTAITILKKVDGGKLALDSVIGRTSIQALLETMINRSDNDSWETLNNLATFHSLRDTLFRMKLDNTNMDYNQTTAKDVASLLQQLHENKALSKESTNLLLSLMQQTETEDRIPAALNSDIEIFHKTGSYEDQALHDAAIINIEDKTYILVILGRKTTREAGTKTIQDITRQLIRSLET